MHNEWWKAINIRKKLLLCCFFTSRNANLAKNGDLKELSKGKEAFEEFGNRMFTLSMSVGAPTMKSIWNLASLPKDPSMRNVPDWVVPIFLNVSLNTYNMLILTRIILKYGFGFSPDPVQQGASLLSKLCPFVLVSGVSFKKHLFNTYLVPHKNFVIIFKLARVRAPSILNTALILEHFLNNS